MNRILAVIFSLALSSVTLSALAQDHRGRDGGGNHQNQGRGGEQHRGGGWENGRDNQGRNDRRGGDNQGRNDRREWDNQGRNDRRAWDNQGRNDRRGWDNQGRNDRRDWDRNHSGRDDRHHDNRWNHRGWDRRDWRRSWNHGWSGSRYRSTSRYYYPRGYSARHWSIGVRLPSVFYGTSYYVNYSSYGLAPPPWGCQWVRIDSDVMLVDISSGEVLDVLYGFYY